MEKKAIDLKAMFTEPKEKQTMVLLDILKKNAHSEWGERYNFQEISSIEEYRRRVPITEFEEYKADIERLKRGEKDILYPGETEMFLASSGSTGIPKYIPESAPGLAVKKKVSSLRRYAKMLLFPELLKPGVKLLALSNPSEYEKTEGGIPVGSASGQAAAGSDSEELRMLAIPAELLAAGNLSAEDREYLMALFAVAEPNVQGIICNNPAHIERLMEKVNEKWEAIAEDLKNGVIARELPLPLKEKLEKKLHANPERSGALSDVKREKGTITPADLWQEFKVLSCWTSGSVGRVLKTVRSQLPEGVSYLDCGYGASEGKFNIPVEKNTSYGLPAVFGYFFEFLPLDGGEPLCLWETEEGVSYELVITSYSGLYRYNMHDIVTIGSKWADTPQIVFACKKSDSLCVDGKEIYAHELYALAEEYETENHSNVKFLEICHAKDELVLAVEPGDGCREPEAFIAYMNDCLEKRYQIRLTGGWLMKDGYRNSLFVRKLKEGKTVNQTKLATFTERLPEESYIEKTVF